MVRGVCGGEDVFMDGPYICRRLITQNLADIPPAFFSPSGNFIAFKGNDQPRNGTGCEALKSKKSMSEFK